MSWAVGDILETSNGAGGTVPFEIIAIADGHVWIRGKSGNYYTIKSGDYQYKKVVPKFEVGKRYQFAYKNSPSETVYTVRSVESDYALLTWRSNDLGLPKAAWLHQNARTRYIVVD